MIALFREIGLASREGRRPEGCSQLVPHSRQLHNVTLFGFHYNLCHNDNIYECCSHDKYLVLIFSLNSNPTTETVSSTVDAVLVFSIIYLGLTFLIITLDLPQKSTLRIVYVTRIFLCLLSLEPLDNK